MIVDSPEQRQHLLIFLSRAHRAPEEVPAFEAVRTAVVNAEVPQPEPPEPEE